MSVETLEARGKAADGRSRIECRLSLGRQASQSVAVRAQAAELGLSRANQVPARGAVKGPSDASAEIHHEPEFVPLNAERAPHRLNGPSR